MLFYIIAHRGLWGGNIIQNTREAAELSIRAGADIIEIDICKSKDGVYYLFHNGMEKYLLGTEEPLQNITSKTIDF